MAYLIYSWIHNCTVEASYLKHICVCISLHRSLRFEALYKLKRLHLLKRIYGSPITLRHFLFFFTPDYYVLQIQLGLIYSIILMWDSRILRALVPVISQLSCRLMFLCFLFLHFWNLFSFLLSELCSFSMIVLKNLEMFLFLKHRRH